LSCGLGAAAGAGAAGWDAACCCFSMVSATELVDFWYLGRAAIKRHKVMKTTARMVVNFVQKVLPLVPRRLWPVPENNPPEVLGCWIKTTPTKSMAVKTNRMEMKALMWLLVITVKLVLF